MKKISLILALLCTAVLLISCDAPGVYVLDEQLPPLTEKTTGYTVTTSIVVTRMSTEESVEITEPKEMEVFHQHLEGVKCIRDSDISGVLPRYSITFFTAESADTLFVASDKDFILDNYHYEAMKAGIDTVYLESLFPAIPAPTAEAEG